MLEIVPTVFQLEINKFKIMNPEWNNCLLKLTKRVEKGLGCHWPIEAKLYKMLILKKNGHFKKHMILKKIKIFLEH